MYYPNRGSDKGRDADVEHHLLDMFVAKLTVITMV